MTMTRPAIFSRHKYTHKAQLAHFMKQIHREFLGFIPFHYMWTNILLCKIFSCLRYLFCKFCCLELNNYKLL